MGFQIYDKPGLGEDVAERAAANGMKNPFWWAPGYEVRGNHEHLIIAKIGKPPGLLPAEKPHALIIAPRREHSRKPDEAREDIAALQGPRVELFARQSSGGFDVWGRETSKFDAAAYRMVQP